MPGQCRIYFILLYLTHFFHPFLAHLSTVVYNSHVAHNESKAPLLYKCSKCGWTYLRKCTLDTTSAVRVWQTGTVLLPSLPLQGQAEDQPQCTCQDQTFTATSSYKEIRIFIKKVLV